MARKPTVPRKMLASTKLEAVRDDFLMSRRAMLCSPHTVTWYIGLLHQILTWMEEDGAKGPGDITSRRVREYLSNMRAKAKSESYINSHARVIRTFVRFMIEEEYIDHVVRFVMPAIHRKEMLCLTADQVQALTSKLKESRNRVMVTFMVDTGVRRAELIALNWEDVDLGTGAVKVRRGKGGNSRTVVAGFKTRKALMRYRRSVVKGDKEPLFQTRKHGRFSIHGIQSLFYRMSEETGIKVTPHALRRTFATLSLRSGMGLIHLQGLMGHTTVEMTRQYISLLEEDLLAAHQDYGPVDRFLK